MERREFGRVVAAGSVGALISGGAAPEAAAPQAPARRAQKALMHVGCQSGGTTTENLEFKARHGVFNIDGGAPATINGVGWDLDDSLRKREACEKYGISLDAYHLPLVSSGIDTSEYPNIMLGKSPDRDREISIIQQMIQVASKTGVRALLYNTTILPVLRTGRMVDPRRGNAEYNVWDYEEAVRKNDPKTIAGDVSIDQMYERITYLLDRIIPVAEEYKVQLANHIADPPTPGPVRGITRWTGAAVFEGLKRFANLSKSPYHGFNLCLGTVSEGLKDPNTEIHPIIRYVGERKQIFNVHLRNIKGGFNHFMEVYPDNGDVNFHAVLRTLRDVGYPYMVMPDHVPHHPAPGADLQAFAFGYGYLKAMIQAVNAEVA